MNFGGSGGFGYGAPTRSDRERVMVRDDRRLERQLNWLQKGLPGPVRGAMAWLRRPAVRWVRIPVAALFILGGFAGFLPVLGFWMVPLGLLLLAIDVPALRPCVSKGMILLRRRTRIWHRRWREWRAR